MGKVVFQFSVVVVLFFLAWFGLGRIDYMKIFELEGISRRSEQKIGDVIMKSLKKSEHEIVSDDARLLLDKIKTRLCESNDIDTGDIHIHLMRSNVVNAYTLPGHHIVVYTGLVSHCDSESELCGVIAHELGHIELNHVMKRLAGEVGLSVLASMASNGNSEMAGNIIRKLSSSAFERQQESDADAAAVRYMIRAHIDPHALSAMMLKFAAMQSSVLGQMEWISSHPDSKKRAEAINKLIGDKELTLVPVATDEEWDAFKDAARGGGDN